MNRRRGALAVALLLLLLLAFALLEGSGDGPALDPDRPLDEGTSTARPGVVPSEARRVADGGAEDFLAGPNPFETSAGDDPSKGDLLVEVRRYDGARVLGATVLVDGGSKETDEEGYALFAGIEPAAKYEIHAYGTDIYDVPGTARIGVTAGCRSEVRIVLERGGVVRGTLVTPDGRPLGVPAVLGLHRSAFRSLPLPADRSSIRSARCGPGGRFEIRGVPGGTVYVRASAEFHTAAWSRPFAVPPGEIREGLRIVLAPAGAISGRVVERGSGRPIAGAPVRADAGSILPNVYTDAEGRFRLENLAPGRYLLWVAARGMAMTGRPGVEVVAGRVTEGVVVELGSGGSIVGNVTGADGIVAVRFERDFPDVAEGDRPRMAAGVEADGSFSVTRLEPGAWIVRLVSFSGAVLAEERATVTEGRETRVDLRPDGETRGTTVTGRVVDSDGRPVADAIVQLLDAERRGGAGLTQTDAAGNFTLYGAKPGTWRARATGRGGIGISAEFTIGEERGAEGVRVVLVPQVAIVLRAKHASGNVARRVHLTLCGKDGSRHPALCGSDGRCGMNLPPGAFTVHVGRTDPGQEPDPPVATIVVKPGGAETFQTFEIVID